jgi:hypothetical protein
MREEGIFGSENPMLCSSKLVSRGNYYPYTTRGVHFGASFGQLESRTVPISKLGNTVFPSSGVRADHFKTSPVIYSGVLIQIPQDQDALACPLDRDPQSRSLSSNQFDICPESRIKTIESFRRNTAFFPFLKQPVQSPRLFCKLPKRSFQFLK